MFCPSCKDEFRPGFTRCAACDVDLVASLDDVPDAAHGGAAPPQSGTPVMIRMREYCGFLDLDDARDARGRLREAGITADILIRELPDPAGDAFEEYWLRVDAERFREVASILGEDPGTSEER